MLVVSMLICMIMSRFCHLRANNIIISNNCLSGLRQRALFSSLNLLICQIDMKARWNFVSGFLILVVVWRFVDTIGENLFHVFKQNPSSARKLLAFVIHRLSVRENIQQLCHDRNIGSGNRTLCRRGREGLICPKPRNIRCCRRRRPSFRET